MGDHVFGVSALVMIDSLGDESLDTGKVVQIALIHDLVESVVGDIVTERDAAISKAEKDVLEREAAFILLHDLDASGYLHGLFLEYQDRSTPE